MVKETTSKPKNGETYALGEEIKYTITVTNTGNLTATEIKVTDSLSKDEGKVIGTIASLAPGKSETFDFTYTVTEDDILNGKVLNVATAKGNTPDGNKPEGEGEKEDKTEDPNPSFTVVKTLTHLPDKGYFTLGETAEFKITVENTGNLTLTDLTVTEQLSGAKYAESNAYTVNGADAIIAELKPGEQVVIKASYTITEDDLGNKDLKNVVTGKGKGPDGNNPDGDDSEVVVPTDDAISVSGSKTWDDQDNRFEVRPETITLRLHADGAEYKTAEIGADQNWTYKFSKLPKHTESGAEIVYTVTEDAVVGYETTTVETDSGVNFTNTLRQCTLHIDYTYIRHKGGTPHEAFPPVDMVLYYGQKYSVKSPKLWGYVPNIPLVEGVITEDTVVHVLYTGLDYTLTIEYVYEDGTTAAPTHTEVLKIYDKYGVASPKIPGYVPTWEFVAGKMYAHDEYYRIVYRAIKPQGVGNITLNLGDCFE